MNSVNSAKKPAVTIASLTALIAGMGIFVQPAYGQAAAVPAAAGTSDTAADEGETIVVTGTLIQRPDLIASSPVSTISAEQLKQNNVVTVEQILGVNPQFSGNTTGASNNPGDGAATVNLRNLGAQRTLVLIDGKRAPYYDTNGQVDVNSIPTALLKRVDVLTGGASATYGSDAIAGVVNFVLDDRFTGLQIDANNAVTRYKDGATNDISLTAGVKLGDRGNIVVSGSYSNRRGVKFGARPHNGTTLSPADLSPTGSTNANPTVFDLADGSQVQITPGGALTGNVTPYDYTPVNYAQLPLERYTAMALVRYELTDGIEFYGRGNYSHSQVTRILAPTATAGFNFNIDPTNPFLSADQRATFFGPDAAIIGVTPDVNVDPSDPTSRVGSSQIGIRRRITETPGRVNPTTSEAYQLLGGFRGDLGGYHWDVSAQYGEVVRNQILGYDLSYSALQQALDVVPGPGGTPVCRSGAAGCIPLDVFSATTLSGNALSSVLRDGSQRDKTTQFIASANVSGDLSFLKSPWAENPAAVAVGVEYRKETGRTTVDANYGSGDLIYYGQGQNIAGKYDVKEAFIELKMPLVQDRPFAYSLGIEAGYRYSDYSTSGGVSNYKFGGDWAPVNGLRFRGIYQRATRAPNLYELFSPVVAGTGNLQTDPCAGSPVPTDVAAICIAQGARPQTIGGIAQPTAGQINIFTGGNPNLQAEKSDTFTVGVVVNPVSMRRLSLSIDYYDIKIANAIDTVPAAVTVNQCYNVDRNAASAACSGIRRNLTGSLSGNIQYGVPEVYGNLSKLSTRGLDASLRYNGGERTGFSYSLALAGSYTFNYKKQNDPSAQTFECAGRFGAACNLEPISKWKHVAELGLGWKELQLITRWRYLGAVHQDAGTDILINRIPGISYIDMTFSATVKENVSLRLGMQNVFDKKSPIIGDAVNQYVAGNTFPNTYDVMGRTFFVGFSAKL